MEAEAAIEGLLASGDLDEFGASVIGDVWVWPADFDVPDFVVDAGDGYAAW